MNSPWFRRAVGVLLLFWFALRAAAATVPPNVVFILVDDFGWTDLSSYGSRLYQTPNVDRLAQQGMRFDNAYAACTVCSPTRASIMTGRYPAALKITDWIAGHNRPYAKLRIPDWTQFLALDYYTLAEAFHDSGYVTAHIGKWHLGEAEKYWPEHQGFDLNIGGWGRGSPNKGPKSDGYFSPYGNPRLTDGPNGEFLTRRLTQEAVTFLEKNKSKPFFLNFWLYSVHLPLQAEADKIAKYEKLVHPNELQHNPVYAAMVEHMDDSVGELMSTLDRLGLAENTIVIFTSDNGGILGISGDRTKAPRVTSNAPLRLGKGDMYEGGVRVPLIVRYPHHVPENVTSHVPVISPDYYPTLLELAAVKPKNTAPLDFDGVSIAPVLRDPQATLSREAIYWHYPHYHTEGGTPYSAIRKGDWKLIEVLEDGHLELYNLAQDLGEKNNLATSMPDKARELHSDLKAWREKMHAQMPTENPNYDAVKDAKKKAGGDDTP